MQKCFPIALFCLILAALLVGQRFGMPKLFPNEPQSVVRLDSANGVALFVKHGKKVGVVGNKNQRRGQIIFTGESTYASFFIGESTRLFLDERTDVELIELTRGKETIKLIRGRILLEHERDTPITVTTNFTKSFFTNGLASFVNFDFQETVHVIPLEETTVAVSLGKTGGTVTKTPVRIHETDPQSIADFSPSLHVPPANNFYAWTKGTR